MAKDKQQFQDMLNTMSRTFQHFLDNADDVSIFYTISRNVFLRELYGTNTELKNYFDKTYNLYKLLESKADVNLSKIKSDDKLLGVEEKLNNNIATINDYKMILQKRLDFMLNCIYAYEVKSGSSYFVYQPPYYDDITRYALQRRNDNLDTYKKINQFWTTKRLDRFNRVYPKDIYVLPEATAKNVLKGDFGNAMRANTNFILDNKTQKELIFGVKKVLLYEKLHKSSSLNYEYLKRFYIGYYQDKPVLFTEIISKVNNNNKTGDLDAKEEKDLQNVSYQLNVVLNGSTEENRLLYRMDYRPINNHINKLDCINLKHDFPNGKIEKQNQEYFKNAAKNKANFHIHMPSEKYCVLFPNFLHSADTKDFGEVFENFDDFVNFNRKLANINTQKCLIDKKDLKAFLSSKKIKDKKLLDCYNKELLR